MRNNHLFIKATPLTVLVVLLAACSGSKPRTLDAYEKLEQPPQLAITPSVEAPTVSDEAAVNNGLNDKVTLEGDDKPQLKLAMTFENAWQEIEKTLKHKKIPITDRDRNEGYFLVNFDGNDNPSEQSFLGQVTNYILFDEHYALRKYQLNVKSVGVSTLVTAKDLGLITQTKDSEKGREEIVDSADVGSADSTKRLLENLYKSLHDGFVESENHHNR